MRKRLPEVGELRVVTKFLWFPKVLRTAGVENEVQVRWLETCNIKQELRSGYDGIGDWQVWVDRHWVDE